MAGRYNPHDRFFQKAKREQFAARSVYKLDEIDRRFKLLFRGARVLDLGCAPGSWMQYIAKAVGDTGAVVGADLARVSVSLGSRATCLAVDVHELSIETIRAEFGRLLGESRNTDGSPADASRLLIDGVLSDMAPKLTGIRDADQARSAALAERALEFARELVDAGGFFAAKFFQGRDTDEVIARTKKLFEDVKVTRPEATRDGSREAFIVARRRRPRGTSGA